MVGIVRRPDPVPCPNCAVGEWDMCRNGQYTERGIKEIDGFMSERWRIEPEYAMKVDRSLGLLGVLLEPTTVVTKAWEQVLAVGQRAFWEPRTVLVTGAGPIGLLAALVGKQRGLEVHVLDRARIGAQARARARARRDLPHRHVADVGFEPDVIVECTGVGQVITDSIRAVAPAVSCASPVSGPVAPRSAPPRPTSRQRWCSRTTSSSAASTPTSGTGTGRARHWPARTARGWRVSSRGASHRRSSCAPSSGSRRTSSSSFCLPKPDQANGFGSGVSQGSARANARLIAGSLDALPDLRRKFR